MSKIELPNVTGGYNLSTINNNFQTIEDALNKEVLYRKGYLGEPNEMQTNLDMNGKQIINVSRLSTNTLEIGGVQVVPTNLVIDTYNGTREALRRSYAEAGYNLVDGSFEAGGTLVKANDVLLQERTGRAYSGAGPFPQTVPAGTDPIAGGFTDVAYQRAGRRSFRSFGAVGNGVVDDYAALQAAIDWAGNGANRCVYGHEGDKHKISQGLVLRFDNKELNPASAAILDFTGTEIVPVAAGITALKVSRNYAKVINPTVNTYSSGRMGVTAYALAPEDENQTSQRVWQMYCTFENPVAYNCDTGFRFKPGPTVGGANSGAFYHTINNPRFQHVTRGFHFQRSVSGDCSNTRIFITNPIHVHGNCMFDMEAVDSLVVTGGSAEFINESGYHTGNPTIKAHKPVSTDSNSVSYCAFNSFYGEVGTTPYDFMATEAISLVNCAFIAYANEGVNNAYSFNNMLTNDGAIVSRAKYSPDSTAMLAVRREAGANYGMAYLKYVDRPLYAAEFYADRGFTFASPIGVARIADLQNTASNSQVMGSSLGRFVVTGSPTTGTVNFYNSSALPGRAFEFDGVYSVGPGTDNNASAGRAASRYSIVYAVTGTINTSDAREKTAPLPIDESVLDAWGDVQLVAFQWLNSIQEKGEASARWHFGVIAQQVRDAFAARGLDGCNYGLLCYDEWDDEYRDIDVLDEEGNSVGMRKELVRTAGDRWGIRADQCLFLEAAYQRRRCDRIEARLSAAGL